MQPDGYAPKKFV